MEPFAVASRGEGGGGDLTNVQCKPLHNCHNESPLYNEYILIKMGKKKTTKERTGLF
jgi:hypothetical protein